MHFGRPPNTVLRNIASKPTPENLGYIKVLNYLDELQLGPKRHSLRRSQWSLMEDSENEEAHPRSLWSRGPPKAAVRHQQRANPHARDRTPSRAAEHRATSEVPTCEEENQFTSGSKESAASVGHTPWQYTHCQPNAGYNNAENRQQTAICHS